MDSSGKSRPPRGETSDPLLSGQSYRKPNRDAEAHIERGVAYRQRGDLEEAIRAFHEAVRFDPQCASARYHLGMAYGLQGSVYQALSELAVAQRLGSSLAAQGLGKARQRPGAFQWRGQGLIIGTRDKVAELLAIRQPPQRVWWEKAGMELCLVPRGGFEMGSPEGEGNGDEHPEMYSYGEQVPESERGRGLRLRQALAVHGYNGTESDVSEIIAERRVLRRLWQNGLVRQDEPPPKLSDG